MIISCIKGRHFLFMDRRQTFWSWIERVDFFSMDGAKIFCSHMVEARIFVGVNPGRLIRSSAILHAFICLVDE